MCGTPCGGSSELELDVMGSVRKSRKGFLPSGTLQQGPFKMRILSHQVPNFEGDNGEIVCFDVAVSTRLSCYNCFLTWLKHFHLFALRL